MGDSVDHTGILRRLMWLNNPSGQRQQFGVRPFPRDLLFLRPTASTVTEPAVKAMDVDLQRCNLIILKVNTRNLDIPMHDVERYWHWRGEQCRYQRQKLCYADLPLALP